MDAKTIVGADGAIYRLVAMEAKESFVAQEPPPQPLEETRGRSRRRHGHKKQKVSQAEAAAVTEMADQKPMEARTKARQGCHSCGAEFIPRRFSKTGLGHCTNPECVTKDGARCRLCSSQYVRKHESPSGHGYCMNLQCKRCWKTKEERHGSRKSWRNLQQQELPDYEEEVGPEQQRDQSRSRASAQEQDRSAIGASRARSRSRAAARLEKAQAASEYTSSESTDSQAELLEARKEAATDLVSPVRHEPPVREIPAHPGTETNLEEELAEAKESKQEKKQAYEADQATFRDARERYAESARKYTMISERVKVIKNAMKQKEEEKRSAQRRASLEEGRSQGSKPKSMARPEVGRSAERSQRRHKEGEASSSRGKGPRKYN